MAACKMRCSNLSALLAVALFCSCAQARLSPSGEVWITAFDPPYDDRTVKVQLKVLDWWTGSQDVAVLRKGTKFPVLDDNCNWDADKCPSWTLPADVQFEIGPPTTADAHRLSTFLLRQLDYLLVFLFNSLYFYDFSNRYFHDGYRHQSPHLLRPL